MLVQRESRKRQRRRLLEPMFSISLLLCSAAPPFTADALILQAGQRLPPLRSTPDPGAAYKNKEGTVSLLELPAVEEWATAENLKERHLKTLYRELLRRPNSDADKMSQPSLFQRLIDQDFPKSAASSLLLHNDQFKFVECTSRVVATSPSQRGCKLAIQFGSEGPIVETVLIRHAADNDVSTESAGSDSDQTIE